MTTTFGGFADATLGRLLVLVLVASGLLVTLLLSIARAWIVPWPMLAKTECVDGERICPDCPATPAAPSTCPLPVPACADGFCATDEDCASCPADCGCDDADECRQNAAGFHACTPAPPPQKVDKPPPRARCGDGKCSPRRGEDCKNCLGDCGCSDLETCRLRGTRYACGPVTLGAPPR